LSSEREEQRAAGRRIEKNIPKKIVSRTDREVAEARLGLLVVRDILYRRVQGRVEAILEF